MVLAVSVDIHRQHHKEGAYHPTDAPFLFCEVSHGNQSNATLLLTHPTNEVVEMEKERFELTGSFYGQTIENKTIVYSGMPIFCAPANHS